MSFLTFSDKIEDWIAFLLHHQPLVGPFLLLLFEEAGIPLPIPGDVYISYIGYQIKQGIVIYWVAFLWLLSAILIGSSILYYLSSRYGKQIVIKFGKYIHLNERKLQFIENKFRKYGPIVIIVGRHIPGFRIPITVFSGISSVSYRTFIFSECISVVFWIALFLQIGEKLGNKTITLLHHQHNFLIFLIVPFALTILSFFFGKLIPEE